MLRTTPLILLAVSTLIGLFALPAVAEVSPISQSRSLDFFWFDNEGTYSCPLPTSCSPISVTHTEDQGADQAAGFASWSVSLGSIVQLDSSALGAQGFTATASHAGTGVAVLFQQGEPWEFYSHTRTTISNANLSYTFEVDTPTPYQLSGAIQTSGAGFLGSMLARVRLEGPGGLELAKFELIEDEQCLEPGCWELGPAATNHSGILPPGIYTVEATLYGVAESLISLSIGIAAANDYQGSFQLELAFVQDVPGLGGSAITLLVFVLLGTGCLVASHAKE